jgi:hypothetical protein
MLVVPLKNDAIETKDGVSFKVLSFSNYRDRGPAVYVEHTPSVPSDAVYFFDIHKINGKSVEYLAGPKVFRSLGPLKRKFQLPQPADIVTYRSPAGSLNAVVKGLKLHKRGALAKGLLIVGEDQDSQEQVLISLRQVIDLKRDIGNDLFSRDRFLLYYKEYAGGSA